MLTHLTKPFCCVLCVLYLSDIILDLSTAISTLASDWIETLGGRFGPSIHEPVTEMPPKVPIHAALCICSFALDFSPLWWCVNIRDWTCAALLLLTDALLPLPLKRTGRSPRDTFIILSSSSLKPRSVFAHMSYLHFRVSLRPSHLSNHLSVFSSTLPVSSCPPPTTGRSTTHLTVCPSHPSVPTTVWRSRR